MDTQSDRETKIVKLKLDIVFKKLFADENNKHVLRRFISDILDIPYDDITKIEVENSEVPPDMIGDKLCRLDLRLKVNEELVNIEIQIKNERYYNDRALFYWSKLYTGDLKSGQSYGKLRKSVCINIVNFNLFDWDNYHSEFTMLEKTHHKPLTDKCAMHFFELKKINRKSLSTDRKELWMQLINAESKEELDMLKQSNVAEIQDSIVIIKKMSNDELLREATRLREKALHDMATELEDAEARGKAEGRAEGRAEGIAEGEAMGIAKIIARMRAIGVDESTIQAYKS